MTAQTSFLSDNELEEIGFHFIGKGVRISRFARFYNPHRIVIGNNVRIDDFCVLSAGEGGITFGNYIHVAVYSSLIGKSSIIINDYCNISSKVAIYSSNDDYSGEFMSNPMVPSEYTRVTHGDVILEKHVLVGSGSIILPNVTLEQGSVVGALSLVPRDCEAFTVYAGVPAKKIKLRSQNLLVLEKAFSEKLEKIRC